MPAIVTVVPIGPEVGENEVMVGACAATVLRKMDTVDPPKLPTKISGFPSPSMSPTAGKADRDSALNETIVPNEKDPGVDAFFRMEI